jgi:microcystin-dependent protein
MWLGRAALAVCCFSFGIGSLQAGPLTVGAGIGKPFSNLQDSIAVNFELPLEGFDSSEAGFVNGMLRTVTRFSPAPQLADGRTISAATNPALGALLGTTYGGTAANPKVPNVAGRAIVGAGTSASPFVTPWSRGTVRGVAEVTLTDANLPGHTHTVNNNFSKAQVGGSANPAPIDNIQPSLGLSYLIRTAGPHPSTGSGPAAYMGTVVPFVGQTAPAGWALCDGAELPVNGNQALYSIIGTRFGGTFTTFKLPDLRGRTIVGAGERPGSSGSSVGSFFGTEKETINILTMPKHTHVISPGVTTDEAGFGQPINNRQPSLTLTYLVAGDGVFPSTDALPEDIVPGEIIAFAGNEAPPGFMYADGRSLAKNVNPSLSALYRDAFGGDDNTFRLPDLRARTLIGAGPGVLVGLANVTALDEPLAVTVDDEGNFVYDLGETAGGSDLPLEVDNMPEHAHEIPEPGSLLLAALAVVGLIGARRGRCAV